VLAGFSGVGPLHGQVVAFAVLDPVHELNRWIWDVAQGDPVGVARLTTPRPLGNPRLGKGLCRARCEEGRTPGCMSGGRFGERPGEPDREQYRHRARADSTR
jgi:hypothetical protein